MSNQTDRLRALARETCLAFHRGAAINSSLMNGPHDWDDDAGDGGFSTCNHPDCVLVRTDPPVSEGRTELGYVSRYCSQGAHAHCNAQAKFANADGVDDCYPCSCRCHVAVSEGTPQEPKRKPWEVVVSREFLIQVDSLVSLVRHRHCSGIPPDVQREMELIYSQARDLYEYSPAVSEGRVSRPRA